MNIISATQQFQAAEKQLLIHSRQEIPARQTPTTTQATTSTTANSDTALLENAAADESKVSDDENEDVRLFNALTTIGTVKRILEQLKSGELLSWINANGYEKIQAQAQSNHVNADPPANRDATTSTVFELNYRYQHVEASFTGSVELADGSRSEFSFAFAMQESYLSFTATQQVALTDPLVLSLSGQPFQWTGQQRAFDLTADGKADRLPTLAASQYYLALDANNDQRINNGKELFGPTSGSGFQELSALDDNGNGFVDSQDKAWQQLRLWRPGEAALTLQQLGIAALSTQSVATAFGLYDGDALLARIARSGIYLNEQGQAGLLQQVDLNV